MTHIKLLRWPTIAALLGWSLSAWGQDVAATPIALPGLDPTSQMLVAVLDSGSLPLVLAFLVWQVSRGMSGFTPTIRVVHVREDAAPWDGRERRRDGEPDR